MIKVKKRKNGIAAAAKPLSVDTPDGKHKAKRSSSAPQSLSSPSQPRKKAKSTPTTAEKAKGCPQAPAASAPTVIKIGSGGVVDCQALEKAVKALCRHVQKLQEKEEVPDLLAMNSGPTVSLMFSTQNIPVKQRIYPHLIELPHSPLASNSEVCLIVRDPQRKWKDLVASLPSLSSVSKVISYKKLPKKFPQFADRRALCAAYDLFVVDTRVKEKTYNSLGKVFFAANKLPLPIRVGSTTLEREVGRALRSTALVIKRGPSLAIRIGRALSNPDHLYENAVAAIKGVADFFQMNHQWKNTITTIHIQATDTPALPIYLHPKYAEAAEYYRTTAPPANNAEPKRGEGEKTKTGKEKASAVVHKVKDDRKIKSGAAVKEGKDNASKVAKKPITKDKKEKKRKARH
ncbi:hypothetical protein, conserved [Eimeria tenella]|uniref:Uncharacterized protein n=1 Tax=Eimeria tenella TaxID=5802 RepID=U6KSJ7_EIMTE|nr:hypothetical protein, conserved [Eimeria tenella]CDJ39359.1 hypothetical protein, conserved [Eimeria tenella]|eukprot:XP_013230114.1 hypothetical protein, conserved [Eimeria tenella]